MGQNGSGPAITSPIRVPLPTDQVSGLLYPKARQDVLAKIVAACGGRQCINVAPAYGEGDDGNPCDTVTSVAGSKDTDGDGVGDVVDKKPGETIILNVNRRCPKGAPASTTTTPP